MSTPQSSVTAHSKLFPPSSSERWTACAASAVLQPESTSSQAADNGTVQHAATEDIVLHYQATGVMRSAQEFVGKRIKVEGNGAAREVIFEQTFVKHVDWCASRVRLIMDIPGAIVFVEKRGNFSHITGEDGSFGTSDIVALIPLEDGTWELIVGDHKFGKHLVNVCDREGRKHNSQLGIYALCAIHAARFSVPISKVTLKIWQPYIVHFEDSHTWDVAVFEQWGKFVAARAAAVLTARNHYRITGDIPLNYYVPGDVQCQWCRVEKCPKRVINNSLSSYQDNSKVSTASADEFAAFARKS